MWHAWCTAQSKPGQEPKEFEAEGTKKVAKKTAAQLALGYYRAMINAPMKTGSSLV